MSSTRNTGIPNGAQGEQWKMSCKKTTSQHGMYRVDWSLTRNGDRSKNGLEIGPNDVCTGYENCHWNLELCFSFIALVEEEKPTKKHVPKNWTIGHINQYMKWFGWQSKHLKKYAIISPLSVNNTLLSLHLFPSSRCWAGFKGFHSSFIQRPEGFCQHQS